MIRCINVDWLTLYGSIDDHDIFRKVMRNSGFTRIQNQKSTNNFSIWDSFVCEKSSRKYLELCYCPYSIRSENGGGIFDKKDCTIQLCNKWLYSPDGLEKFMSLISSAGFKYKSISKIDICYDFQRFDNNMTPQTLIKGFFACKYWKVGLVKCSSYQKQSTTMEYSGIYFGAPTSGVKVRLYNKSLELREQKDKPYIRDSWYECGLNTNKDTWRLEISIRPSGKSMVQLTSGEILSLKPRDIISRNSLRDIFFSYACHYFKFRHNNGKTLKKYAKEVQLFNKIETWEAWKPKRLTESLESGRTERLIVKRLVQLIENGELKDESEKAVLRTIEEVSRVYRIKILDELRSKKNIN